MAANMNSLTAGQFFGAQQQPQQHRPVMHHPQQLTKLITQHVSSHPIPSGWQMHHLAVDRVGKIAQMYERVSFVQLWDIYADKRETRVTNSQLANGNADSGEILVNALNDERSLFISSSTKVRIQTCPKY